MRWPPRLRYLDQLVDGDGGGVTLAEYPHADHRVEAIVVEVEAPAHYHLA
jgi:hypothetical protein